MKCIKCCTKNVHNANYCKKCAYDFPETTESKDVLYAFSGMKKG